jgi:hypothetical protein
MTSAFPGCQDGILGLAVHADGAGLYVEVSTSRSTLRTLVCWLRRSAANGPGLGLAFWKQSAGQTPGPRPWKSSRRLPRAGRSQPSLGRQDRAGKRRLNSGSPAHPAGPAGLRSRPAQWHTGRRADSLWSRRSDRESRTGRLGFPHAQSSADLLRPGILDEAPTKPVTRFQQLFLPGLHKEAESSSATRHLPERIYSA